jgi:RNA-directed DNA polymerase
MYLMPDDIHTLYLFENGQNSVGGGFSKGGFHAFDTIISVENLLLAWREFLRGKRGKRDVQEFGRRLADSIFDLHRDLARRIYVHGEYHAFNISDPKPRNIHKATVRDRLLHHAVYRVLYPQFDTRFIADSYSCRHNQGTHRAIRRFEKFSRKVSKNNTRTCWVLKCDIRKFFASIDQETLICILKKHQLDVDTIRLFERIIRSFSSGARSKGLPLGNLTSQLLVNVYMNEFDYFMKQKLKVKYYIRYADDFVVVSDDRSRLVSLVPYISQFLDNNLKLSLHPDKLFIKTLASGVDFLGWVHFPKHRTLRTVTKRRMLKNLSDDPSDASRASYLGMLKHGNAHKLTKRFVIS